MKKKAILVICLSLLFILMAFKPNAWSRTKSYYSGEAVSYDGKTVFATANTGALELFILDGDEIVRTAMFKPKFVSLPKGGENYSDLEFSNDGGRLYLYLTDGRYLYKYDVSNPYSPKMMEKLKDNSWDWFHQITKTDDYLVTIGSNDIKFWNYDLKVVNAYKLDYEKAENVSVSRDSRYIFTIVDNVLGVYSTEDRKSIANIWIETAEDNIQGVYYDEARKEIFVTDNEALKVFSLQGALKRKFEHTSEYGYDVAVSALSDSVYFSDGIGIVKNDKRTMRALDWKHTTAYTEGRSWTMDIEVVGDYDGDKIVAFNNSEILVLDSDLELIDSFKATEVDEAPIEKLSLSLDKKRGYSGDYLTVSGQGFEANEEIKVKMGRESWMTNTDSNGRFKRTITIVDINPGITSIKVDGLRSGLTYSISFQVD